MKKTLQQIFEQDAKGKFPFEVKGNVTGTIYLICGFNRKGYFIIENDIGSLNNDLPSTDLFTFHISPKRKIKMIEYVLYKPGNEYSAHLMFAKFDRDVLKNYDNKWRAYKTGREIEVDDE